VSKLPRAGQADRQRTTEQKHQDTDLIWLLNTNNVTVARQIDTARFNVLQQHIIGHNGDGFLNDRTNSVKALKEDRP